MTDTVVVEGQVKFRDGKKWKSRWVALRKPSPVADCLLLLAYKDKADKTKGHKERTSVTLEDICGLEPGPSYEGVSYTLSILCLGQGVMLGFENKEALLAWDVRIRYSLGEVHRFCVGVQPGTKLESGPATLHLCNNLLVIARDLPPAIVGQWRLSDLRRYGSVPNGFVFEGGTRCGYWAGVFFLSCAEGEQLSFLFDCIVRGISPTRGPFGLRPALPDPNASPGSLEERVNHEAQELEKRLSLLSHCSRQSSSASTSSYGPSVASDERSISSSSSEASHSDTSIGSRLTLWAEPAKAPLGPAEPPCPPPTKSVLHAEENLCAAVLAGARPPPRPPRHRGLQEIGRQSSADSGIATGSHSSYSGSFSSYTGSLDACPGDEFGSLLSLPDHNLCTCPPCEPPRGLGSEYQVPSSLRHLYDTPRSLLQGFTPKDQAGAEAMVGEVCGDAPKLPPPHKQGQTTDCRASEAVPPAGGFTESLQPGMSRSQFAACPICGGLKGTTLLHSGFSPMPVVPDKRPKRKEEKGKVGVASEAEEMSSYELMGSCGKQRIYHETEGAGSTVGPSGAAKVHRQSSVPDPTGGYELMASTVDTPKRCDLIPGEYGGVFMFPADTPALQDRPRGDGVTYVNIPISPASKKQLHYMELELQEPGSGVRGNTIQLHQHRGGSTKYAQIDITATETAHKVGTHHAQCREEGLQELEHKRKGAQH